MRSILVPTLLAGFMMLPLCAAAQVVYGGARSFPADPSTADRIIITIPDGCGDLVSQPAEISTSSEDNHVHDLNVFFDTPDEPRVCPSVWPPGGYHAFDIGPLPEGLHTVHVHELLDGEATEESHDVTFTVSNIAGKSVSGAWYAPEQSGRGVFIIRMPLLESQSAGENLFGVYWANHDAEGSPSWALMTGQMSNNVVGGGAINTSGDPLAPGDATLEQQPRGTVSFEYLGCDRGRLTWNAIDAGITDGSADVVKLASPDGQDPCTVSGASEAVWLD